MRSAFENAFTHAPIGMALVDMSDRLLRVNDAMCRITGYTAEQMCALSLRDMSDPHDADVGVEGWGATVAEAFEQEAHALTAIITLAEVQPQVPVEVKCVEWLNATPEAQKPGGLPRP